MGVLKRDYARSYSRDMRTCDTLLGDTNCPTLSSAACSSTKSPTGTFSLSNKMSGEGDTNVRLIESYLYGSSRTKAREAAKKLLETDHVTENFQKGVEPPRVEEAFCSETGLSFRVRSVDTINGLLLLPCTLVHNHSHLQCFASA